MPRSSSSSRSNTSNGGPDVDYYAVLNLLSSCTASEIKKSYQRLALTFHPDKANAANAQLAQVEFEKVKKAHAVLSDPATRAAYDAFGDKGVRMLESDPAGVDVV
ncbi:hypothetical protein TrLO_g10608 [Triparma laevis f. longispina]|uniref:J domain-containing protein n=1 Tax=Triparma laevis f. longispina TaxID=1714387 RepID=A0A9W7AN23_9STRA|nr:hypothetical protein TrLO_g10608 [Triparma laevis f. longispina]